MKRRIDLKKLVPCYSESGHCENCKLPQQAWPTVALLAMNNLWALRGVVLEPARERYGKTFKILKCFLCWKEMKKLKTEMRRAYGAYDMDFDEYFRGECADICATKGLARAKNLGTVPDATRRENLKIAKAIVEGGVWDRLILENVGDTDWIPEYVHVSYKKPSAHSSAQDENRRQVLLRKKGSGDYEEIEVDELLDLIT